MRNSIVGLDKFLNHLHSHSDCYVVIGGIATRITLEDAGLEARVTKDFDVVLLADGTNAQFARDIANLLKEGQYQNYTSNEKRVCFRFVKPQTNGYPTQIELFAGSNNKTFERYLQKVPIVVDEEQLSAIILDENVFEFIKSRRVLTEEGLPIVDIYGLIALKSFAYFENFALYEKGKVTESTYTKHKSDIIRLLLALPSGSPSISLPPILLESAKKFVDVLSNAGDVFKRIVRGEVKLNISDLVIIYKRVFCGE